MLWNTKVIKLVYCSYFWTSKIPWEKVEIKSPRLTTVFENFPTKVTARRVKNELGESQPWILLGSLANRWVLFKDWKRGES